MTRRAESADATRLRIIDATIELFAERWAPEVTLRDIASRAEVALQTVINQFGNRAGLVAAALASDRGVAAAAEFRGRPQPDQVARAAELLVRDYERNGDHIIGRLALENTTPGVAPVLAAGRAGHRAWVEAAFPGALGSLRGARLARRLALLITATDVYTWKLLRRDQGLSVTETTAAMRELVEALYADKSALSPRGARHRRDNAL